MFLLWDEHTWGKLTLTGLATSRNWPQFLYSQRPKGVAKKRMSKGHKKGIKKIKSNTFECHDLKISMVGKDAIVVTWGCRWLRNRLTAFIYNVQAISQVSPLSIAVWWYVSFYLDPSFQMCRSSSWAPPPPPLLPFLLDENFYWLKVFLHKLKLKLIDRCHPMPTSQNCSRFSEPTWALFTHMKHSANTRLYYLIKITWEEVKSDW